MVGSCFLGQHLNGDITLQVRIVGAVLFRMFYETFEKFDDAVQTVHPVLGISGPRQLMAFVGVADIFNGPIENLEALVQKQ